MLEHLVPESAAKLLVLVETIDDFLRLPANQDTAEIEDDILNGSVCHPRIITSETTLRRPFLG
jgi:hypothetical protein